MHITMIDGTEYDTQAEWSEYLPDERGYTHQEDALAPARGFMIAVFIKIGLVLAGLAIWIYG